MKHLTILVPEGQNNLSSIVGAWKLFTRANKYRVEKGKDELFKIELAGISGMSPLEYRAKYNKEALVA